MPKAGLENIAPLSILEVLAVSDVPRQRRRFGLGGGGGDGEGEDCHAESRAKTEIEAIVHECG
jgi:hypothetical protein